MDFLRDYTISIVMVSVLSVLLEIIMPPENYKKYIRMALGLLVVMVIISPVKKLFKEEFSVDLNMGSGYSASQTPPKNQMIIEVFKKRLEEEIEKEILSTKKIESQAEVNLSVNENGEITEISGVKIEPFFDGVKELLEDKFGIEREKIGGFVGGD